MNQWLFLEYVQKINSKTKIYTNEKFSIDPCPFTQRWVRPG
ncbi:hypothetical protein BC643_4663 [Mangrovibacterium diazotrophicum]|uniref:Uncharacterized protein n=1 Tax=Mangrovibacterium diazotrophicum TaxID=1261403 RepID=A0A419VUM2_9BACT|nr:hypothetical protein BC643_4663 [Mangrovibacterium diazotrophicum]